MTRFQRLASTVSILAMASVLGFGAVSVAHAAPEEAGVTQGAPSHRGHHRHHGDLLSASLRLESPTDAQRAQIEALRAQERGARQNVRVARGQLMQAVANGLSAGNVDDKSVAPAVQAVEGAVAADEPGERAALEKLHAVLTPAQRAELVSRLESRETRMREHAGDGGAPRGDREGRIPFGRELGLSDAQKTQIRTNFQASKPAVDPAVWTEARAEHQRVLEAFKGDRFVMNEIAPAKDPRLVSGEVEGMVRMAKASAPVLTPAQRATAASKLRDMAARSANAPR